MQIVLFCKTPFVTSMIEGAVKRMGHQIFGLDTVENIAFYLSDLDPALVLVDTQDFDKAELEQIGFQAIKELSVILIDNKFSIDEVNAHRVKVIGQLKRPFDVMQFAQSLDGKLN